MGGQRSSAVVNQVSGYPLGRQRQTRNWSMLFWKAQLERRPQADLFNIESCLRLTVPTNSGVFNAVWYAIPKFGTLDLHETGATRRMEFCRVETPLPLKNNPENIHE